MKKTIGIILIAIGLAMIAYTGFNYVTKEKVADLGLYWPHKSSD
ncbi:MAG: hypothetical protein PHE03_10650 [Bacteroidales bacterium]|nr:hypothetical protein [Bacteroidales bacterium]MDD3892746.1 hypothetical protein [Bacteroidales bacterium]